MSERMMNLDQYATLYRIAQHRQERRGPAPEENIAAELEPLAETLTHLWHALAPRLSDDQFRAMEEAITEIRSLVVALRT